MPNKKHIKLGLVFLAVVVIALGIGIGVGTKNKNTNIASSSKNSQEMDGLDSTYDIDCEERRILVVPGTEKYDGTPSKRRMLIRRLGTESFITESPEEMSYGTEMSYEYETVTTPYEEESKVESSSDAGSKVKLSSKSSKSESTSDAGSKLESSSKSSKSDNTSSKASKSEKVSYVYPYDLCVEMFSFIPLTYTVLSISEMHEA